MDLDLSEQEKKEKTADPSPQKEACFEVRTHHTLQECSELAILLPKPSEFGNCRHEVSCLALPSSNYPN